MTTTLVLLRHGESEWNRENRFTGWTDVSLSDKGLSEARRAGALLTEAGHVFDAVHTSLLRRAITTVNLALDEMGLGWLPVQRSWRLNERHYGSLQGLDKRQTAEKYGADQVFQWRRSFSVRPPPIDHDDPRHPRNDRRYARLAPDVLPATECLADVVQRVLPYWHDAIVPQLRLGQRVLLGAHGNSLRALVKHLDGVSDDDIAELNIPTGVPLVYELDDRLTVVNRYYLGDPEETARAAAAVAAQAGRIER